MSVNVLTAQQMLCAMEEGYNPVIAPLPYTSMVDRVARPGRLEFGDWRGAVADCDIRLSHPTLVVCRAAASAALRLKSEMPHFAIAGEHTFGADHTSTTTLMKREITTQLCAAAPGKRPLFPEGEPRNANTTTHQIAWLAKHASRREGQQRTLLLTLGEQHAERAKILAKLYGLEADIVNAADILKETVSTPTTNEVMRIFEAKNAKYERRALLVTRCIAPLGQRATTWAFEKLSARQGPNTVDVDWDTNGELVFSQMPASQRVQRVAA